MKSLGPVYYRWQKEFIENGATAFEQKARPNHFQLKRNGSTYERLRQDPLRRLLANQPEVDDSPPAARAP